uniref:Uncharacterized protein n=1 Tax=Romanomermis culicivorax TaxID=13658 RepID=A0A915IRX6_ROMCU
MSAGKPKNSCSVKRRSFGHSFFTQLRQIFLYLGTNWRKFFLMVSCSESEQPKIYLCNQNFSSSCTLEPDL